MHVALFVESDGRRRGELAAACDAQGMRALLAESIFEAMGLLGRTDIGAVVFPVGSRVLAARGLCQLSDRHHPEVTLFAELQGELDADKVIEALNHPRLVLVQTLEPVELVARVTAVLRGMRQAEESEPTVIDFARPFIPDDDETGPITRVPAHPAPVEMTIPTLRTPVLFSDTAQSIPAEHSTVDAAAPLIVGEFRDTPSVELLMSLCVQGLTGKLSVDAGASIYFYGGDPVWAEHEDGPAGWLAELQRQGKVAETTRLIVDSEASLISALLERNALSGEASHDLCRGLVSRRLYAMLDMTTGSFSFVEGGGFLRTAPLVRLSLFGLLLGRSRMRASPSEVLRKSSEIGGLRVYPTPSLAVVASRLNSFAAGQDLAQLIDGQRLCREIWTELRLDPVTGTLLLQALIEAKLCRWDDDPHESTGQITLQRPAEVEMTVPYASEIGSADDEPSEEARGRRDEIFSLYARLKPLVTPRDVLGVPIDADLGAIEAAYESRMEALKPERIPGGSARQLMVARVMELRDKVTHAYESLMILEEPPKGGPW